MKIFIIILLLGTFSLFSEETKVNKEKTIQLIKELGAEHYKTRRNAKKALKEMGFRIVPILKEELSKAKDPEVSENLKEVIKILTHRLHMEQLSDKEQRLAKLPFKTMKSEETAQARVYAKEKCMVLDINNVRIIIENEVAGLKYEHTFEMDLNSNSGGGSSTTGNLVIYKYSYKNGTGFWNVCGEDMIIENGNLKIFGKSFDLSTDKKQILFVDSKRKPKGILDLN